MRRWRRMLWLAGLAPALAFAQSNEDQEAMTGGLDQQEPGIQQPGAEPRDDRNVAPPDLIASDAESSRLVTDDVPIEPPAPVEETYGRSTNPPGPGDEVRVRKNFSPELQDSAGNAGP